MQSLNTTKSQNSFQKQRPLSGAVESSIAAVGISPTGQYGTAIDKGINLSQDHCLNLREFGKLISGIHVNTVENIFF